MHIEGSEIVFSTGRRADIAESVIGIGVPFEQPETDPARFTWAIASGYDQHLDDTTDYKPLTAEECIELAEYMSTQWLAYRDYVRDLAKST